MMVRVVRPPDPLVWDQGSRPKVRKLAIRVNVDLASLPGFPGFLNSSWIQVDAGCITGSDIAAWPYSVGILVRFTSFEEEGSEVGEPRNLFPRLGTG